MKELIVLTITALLLVILVGCSSQSSTPIAPSSVQDQEFAFFSDDRTDSGLLYQGTMEIDLESFQIRDSDRTLSSEFNITGFMASACPGGCFRYRILSYADDVLTVELTVENPTALQVYDLKMIFTNLYGKKVLNPDHYTNLFDTAPGLPYNPQIAFAKSDDSRAFPIGPGASDIQILQLSFTAGSNPMVDYVISASYPGQCLEPFDIYEINSSSSMTPTGGTASVSVRFRDHQSDQLMVAADTRTFNGSYLFLTYNSGSDNYQGQFENANHMPEGTYSVIFGGLSPGSSIFLYDFFEITVGEDTLAFEAPRRIDNYSHAALPFLIAPNGKSINGFEDNVYVIYYFTDQIGNEQIDMVRSLDGGDTFETTSTRVNSADPNSIHISPTFDISPDGAIHACWIRGALSGFDTNMEYAKSIDNGASFSDDITLSGTYLELFTDIDAYSNDVIHVCRNGAPSGPFDLFTQTTLDGGSVFGPETDLAYDAFPSMGWNMLFPVMDTDSEGNIFVAFMCDYPGERAGENNSYIMKSTDNGNSYLPAVKFNDHGTDNRLPTLMCHENKVHVAWVDLDSSTYNDIRYSASTDGGLTFTSSVIADDLDIDANEPIIRVDPDSGKLVLAYRAGNIRIQTSVDGVTWSESFDMGTTGTGINIYIDSNSRIHMAWESGGRVTYTRSI